MGNLLFHPLIVHIPIALLPAAVVFELLSLFLPKYGLRLAAVLLLIAGVIGAFLATETGEAASDQARQATPAVRTIPASGVIPQTVGRGRLLQTHTELGQAVRNVFSLLLIAEGALLLSATPALARWRRNWTLSPRTSQVLHVLWILGGIAGIVLIVLAGHYGGLLVYNYGVGVTAGR